MKAFTPIQPKKFQSKPRQNREGKKFKNFQSVKVLEAAEPISFNFSTKNNHKGLYLTTSNMFYFDLLEDKITSNYNFKDVTLSCSDIRSDGKIIYCGSEEGSVRVFEPEKKININSYDKAFKTKVNCIASYENKLLACSNDLTIKYFALDIKTPVSIFDKQFKDYILVNRFFDSNTFLAGGMDKKLKLFDLRSGKVEKSMSISNNQPISDIRVDYITGKIYVASDNQLSLIDSSTFSEIEVNTPIHSSIRKIIITENRLFCVSGAGENFVSVSNKENLSKLYIVKLGLEALDFDITETQNKYATIDLIGKLDIKQKNIHLIEDEKQPDEFELLNPENFATKTISKNYAYFNRGQYAKENLESSITIKSDVTKKAKLQKHDTLLKKFMFKEALDSVLELNNPEYIISLIENLISRNAYHIAILNRSHNELIPLLKFINWKINDNRYQSCLLMIYSSLLNYYYFSCGSLENKKANENSDEEYIIELFNSINKKLSDEEKLQEKMRLLESKAKTAILLNSLGEIY